MLTYLDTNEPSVISLGTSCIVKRFFRANKFPPINGLPFDTALTTHRFVVRSLFSDFENWSDKSVFWSPCLNAGGFLRVDIRGERHVWFNHDLLPEDSEIPEEELQRVRFYKEGIPVKQEAMDRFHSKYQKDIAFLRQVVKEHMGFKRNLVFVRFESTSRIKNAEEMFDALQLFCGATKFILLHVRWVPSIEAETDVLLNPPKLSASVGGSMCFTGSITSPPDEYRPVVADALDRIFNNPTILPDT